MTLHLPPGEGAEGDLAKVQPILEAWTIWAPEATMATALAVTWKFEPTELHRNIPTHTRIMSRLPVLRRESVGECRDHLAQQVDPGAAAPGVTAQLVGVGGPY